ncbi:hypothetical protein JKF63_06671 [Porcisia hertigi]|uniref:VWFA domain-containing protein n=1 Tax=Porcisia hertigi TaxID=2761500 RepID=A0A836LEK5_9TRYP|nr:hypothetical protein JKF63_06671 [Porcisia hertigi]
MDSSAAFCHFPTQERGILIANTYKPISLHAAEVQVRLSGYAAQVILSLEYVNETNKLVQTIAAYTIPSSYQLQCTLLKGPTREISTRSYEQLRPLRSAEGGGAMSCKPLEDTVVGNVATQSVPWGVNPGESILMKAVYYVPIPSTQRTGEIVFTLPASLIPTVQRPLDVQRTYIASFDACSRLRHLANKAGSLRFCVNAELFVPLRGTVELERGTGVVQEMTNVSAKAYVNYVGDSRFQLTYDDDLPLKAYTQMALRVHAPVAETSEPLRLHTITALLPSTSEPSDYTAEVADAVAVSIAPSLSSCPINAEIVFVVDVHSATLAVKAAESVMSAIKSLDGTASLVNVILCRDAHRGKTVSLFPNGSVHPSAVPHKSVLAFMREEGAQASSLVCPRGAATLSPCLPSVLHETAAGRGIAMKIPDGYVRNIIVLSDGGGQATEGHTVAMVCEVAKAGRACRVHSVALTATADRAVLEALAEAGGGRFASAVALGGCEDSVGAVQEALEVVLSAAAVPCLVDIYTHWDVTTDDVAAESSAAAAAAAPSPLRMATSVNGDTIACIPLGTQRLIYGLLSSATSQLAVRLFGRVGEMRLEYTASSSVQSSPQLDVATAAPDEEPDAVPMLMTAAVAARIAYLSHAPRAITEAETHEVIALSQRYMLPSPYTTLTDGNSSPGGAHKTGGVVHLPSIQEALQRKFDIRARRVELQAATALGASHSV